MLSSREQKLYNYLESYGYHSILYKSRVVYLLLIQFLNLIILNKILRLFLTRFMRIYLHAQGKNIFLVGAAVHAFDPRTLEAEVGRSL